VGEREKEDARHKTQGAGKAGMGEREKEDARHKTQGAGKKADNQLKLKNSALALVFGPPPRGDGGCFKHCESGIARIRENSNSLIVKAVAMHYLRNRILITC